MLSSEFEVTSRLLPVPLGRCRGGATVSAEGPCVRKRKGGKTVSVGISQSLLQPSEGARNEWIARNMRYQLLNALALGHIQSDILC